ncbi:hypothetical protein [Bradyrhizobium sp. 192]|uniref:hypothetical protein n=1 Tax=Bradyrhizobium sp. 192 TaxID=2782660 RepID=UPI001FFF0E11|nr:hypothetical protein [Bradyrhizobium sp. 192]UPJ55153.1 hypothetical protein IVB24_20930 [Bradyrhizobium sp. 192]
MRLLARGIELWNVVSVQRATEAALLPGVVSQSGDVPRSVPDIKIVSIEQLGRFLLSLFVVSAVQLVDAGDTPLIV